MKKKVFTKKLLFSKETVATLNHEEMNAVFAGARTEIGDTCLTDAVCCPNNAPTDTQLC